MDLAFVGLSSIFNGWESGNIDQIVCGQTGSVKLWRRRNRPGPHFDLLGIGGRAFNNRIPAGSRELACRSDAGSEGKSDQASCDEFHFHLSFSIGAGLRRFEAKIRQPVVFQ